MARAIEGLVGIVFLLAAGECVSQTPTGEELFEAEQMETVMQTYGSDLVAPRATPELPKIANSSPQFAWSAPSQTTNRPPIDFELQAFARSSARRALLRPVPRRLTRAMARKSEPSHSSWDLFSACL